MDKSTDVYKKAPIDLSLCIVCQKVNEESLVEKPNSHEIVLRCVKEWASYGDLSYSETWAKLSTVSPQELEENGASWHRNCYKSACNSGMLKRAKERYTRQLAGPDESRRKSRPTLTVEEDLKLTRSKTFPHNSNVCFFCDGPSGHRKDLRNVSTFSAGQSLRAAIEVSKNDKLRVKLCTAVDSNDAHAIDIKYHKSCWANNVTSRTSQVFIIYRCIYQVISERDCRQD